MKNGIKMISSFALGSIVAIGVIAYAIDPVYTNQIGYKRTNVEKTINDLYSKVSNRDDYSYDNYLGTVNDYDDDGSFTAQVAGLYKLEAWGAQGQNIGSYKGGYGGYSVGYIRLIPGSQVFFTIGTTSGHNGGGRSSTQSNITGGSGGGATHIATEYIENGLLSDYVNSKDKVLIVAGGGGGSTDGYASLSIVGHGGSGGGIVGSTGTAGTSSVERAPGTGGTQETGGTSGSTSYSSFTAPSFGQGCQANSSYSQYMRVSGGGGWYGGGCGMHSGGGGGSGYINTSILTAAEMYCYKCVESSTTAKTTSVDDISETAKSNTPKSGNGHVRITLVSF